MDNIELLKQENDKLTARLNKAVEVFKEQKANLDNLTSQVESLQKELETYKSTPVADVSEYENKITLLEEDNIKLSEQNHLLEEKIQQNLEVSKSYNDQLLTIDELTKQNEDLQKQLNEYELKLKDSETAYEELHKKYETRKEQQVELLGQIDELKSQVEQRTQQVKATENTFSAEIKKITATNEELQKSVTEYKEAYEGQKKENKETEEQFDRVLKSFEEDLTKKKQELEQAELDKKDLTITITNLTEQLSTTTNNQTKYEEFTNMIIDLVESFTNNGNNIDNSTKIHEIPIKVNTVKNSTGSQFMRDATGMNI